MSLVFGTAPDSWGVWLADDPSQPPVERFLDEVVAAGYRWIELGPYGYLPTDEAELADALGSRGLGLVAGTLSIELSWGWERVRAEADRVARLTASRGGRFVVLLSGGYRSGATISGPRELDDEEWRRFIETTNALGRFVREAHGLRLAFHPHADTVVEYAAQVERFLRDTDPDSVQLCLDTAHYEYRDGDSVQLLRTHPQRIPYLHLKSVEPSLRQRVAAEDLDFATAVRLGTICEPQAGSVDFPALAAALEELGERRWAVVEHDMYPLTDLGRPLPTAIRAREYYEGLGWTVDGGRP